MGGGGGGGGEGCQSMKGGYLSTASSHWAICVENINCRLLFRLLNT